MSDQEKSKYVRIWTRMETAAVQKHLLFVDDLYGTCGNCKHLGLNYLKDKTCPSCKTEFKYITSSLKNPGDIMKLLMRMEKEKVNLVMLERDDFTRTTTQEAVNSLFKKNPD